MAVANAAAIVYLDATQCYESDVMNRFVIALMIFIAAALPGRAQPVDGNQAVVELISAETSAQAGDTVTLALKLEMNPGWHVYWRQPGDAGLPPQILWDASTTATFGEFEWPIPELLPIVPNQIMDYGYSNVVVLPFEAKLPLDAAESHTFTGKADYLICEDVCITESAPVSLTLDIGAPAQGANAGVIMQWRDKTPNDFDGNVALDRGEDGWTLSLAPTDADVLQNANVRFFPYDHHIVHSASQPVDVGESGVCIALTEATDGFDTSTTPEGIIIVEASDGARIGYQIAATDGALLPGTCSERPAMPEVEEAGIGSADYSEGSGTSSATGNGNGGATISGSGSGFSLFAILPLAFLGGLILNLMPCVLPVLSIKALGMTHAAASGHANELRLHGDCVLCRRDPLFRSSCRARSSPYAARLEPQTLAFNCNMLRP